MNKLLIAFDGPGSIHVFEPVDPATPISPDQSVMPTDDLIGSIPSLFNSANLQNAQTVASVENSAPKEGPIVRLFRRFVINHVSQTTGHSTADVADAVAKVETTSGRPILDWLTSGGLQKLIQLILEVLALLAPAA